MKLYRYQLGNIDAIGVADDDEDAYQKRANIDPSFAFTPVNITEVKVEGYTVNVTADAPEKPKRTRAKEE